MVKTIVQSVTFKATPAELFEMYLDSKKHTEATGGKAKLGRREGDAFSAWDGYIKGTNLRIVKNRLIVQTWRTEANPNSILVLSFEKDGKGGRVTLVHSNVPPSDAKALASGWHEHYWEPWRAYLAAKASAKKKR